MAKGERESVYRFLIRKERWWQKLSHKLRIELEVADDAGYDEMEDAILEIKEVKRVYSFKDIDYLEE